MLLTFAHIVSYKYEPQAGIIHFTLVDDELFNIKRILYNVPPNVYNIDEYLYCVDFILKNYKKALNNAA